jgi:hypothetical protein
MNQRRTARHILKALWALPMILSGLALLAVHGSADPVRVPAYTAYFQPNVAPAGTNIAAPAGVTGWADGKNAVVWYGELKASGTLSLALALTLPEADRSSLKLTVDGQSVTAQVTGSAQEVTVPFGSVTIPAPGAYRFILTGLSKTGKTFSSIEALLLDGPAVQNAHFSQAETRGAPSVHLWYTLPKDAQIAEFTNEVTVKTDPIWSYYMACGFSRGYFGIQVNSPTERRIIFSAWDAGKEPTDRSKVAQDNQVQLIAKGPNVFTGSFGHEGTGGHSHLVYPWKTGQTYRFAVTAQPDGTGTIYSGYFYFPERKAWGLIASFRAPKDGGYLHGLYSFNEEFNAANGFQKRQAEFGPQWIKTAGGTWAELRTAHFTYTKSGSKDRQDRAAGVDGDRFFLSNGGFVPTGVKYGDEFTRPVSGKQPEIMLPPLPQSSVQKPLPASREGF